MSKTFQAKRIALNGTGLILLVLGIVLFFVGYGDDQHHGQSLRSSQFTVGGVLIGIGGIILLWRGSKLKRDRINYDSL